LIYIALGKIQYLSGKAQTPNFLSDKQIILAILELLKYRKGFP
jgi:hypothetical protein